MGRFLFTTILLNDLGVPTRSMPIALELKKRGHEVAFCNPMPAPSRFIEEAGVSNLPIEMSTRPPTVLAPMSPEFRNLDEMMNMFGHLDEQFVEGGVQTFTKVINDFAADVVVDSFMPTACISPLTIAGSKFRTKLVAKAPGITLVTRILSSSSSVLSVALIMFTACLVAP